MTKETGVETKWAMELLEPAVREVRETHRLRRAAVVSVLVTLATDLMLEELSMEETQGWLRRWADELPDDHKLPTHPWGKA